MDRHHSFHLTYDQLYDDLMQAYIDARRHKRNKPYQRRFENNLDANLTSLCKELWNRTYKPLPSACFIITDPKKREVFAADFRDRVVHHLYFNYVHQMLERTFIQDSYSCIKERGTHYGINRLEHHILQESQNYKEKCYVLKMDIRGYFMHIDRQLLLDITMKSIKRMAIHRISKYSNVLWREKIDVKFVEYLTREIVLLDPIKDCIIHGDKSDWKDLPYDKSLFNSHVGCGLPIGNLTSQLFSNVYLNELDQFMKRILHCRHYGRYVDDFYVVSCDKEWLHSLIPQVRTFLQTRLGLTLHEGKVCVDNVRYGTAFLGAFLKPHRKYVNNTTLNRMCRKLKNKMTAADIYKSNSIGNSIVSCLGVLSHYRSNALKLLGTK